jgi:hypothetical protein
MDRKANGIDVDFMELESEAHLSAWDALMLGLAQGDEHKEDSTAFDASVE